MVIQRNRNNCANKYLVPIRIKSQVVKTVIFSDRTIHARLLGERHYGIGSVVTSQTLVREQDTSTPNPRLDTLKRQKDNATKALKAERARQKITRAQQEITQAQQSLTKKI